MQSTSTRGKHISLCRQPNCSPAGSFLASEALKQQHKKGRGAEDNVKGTWRWGIQMGAGRMVEGGKNWRAAGGAGRARRRTGTQRGKLPRNEMEMGMWRGQGS